MTLRQFGEAAIKILGVYYAASALFSGAVTIATIVLPHQEGFPGAGQIAAMNGIGVLAEVLVAFAFIWRGRTLASWLFRDEALPFSKLSRRDWLFIGISLVGLVWALSGAPAVLEAIGKSIWYAEASRQPMFEEVMRQSAQDMVNAALSVGIGIAVIFSARSVSSLLDREP